MMNLNRKTASLLDEVHLVNEDHAQLKDEVTLLKDSLRALGQSVTQLSSDADPSSSPSRSARPTLDSPPAVLPERLPSSTVARLSFQQQHLELALAQLQQSVELKYRHRHGHGHGPPASLAGAYSLAGGVPRALELSALCHACTSSGLGVQQPGRPAPSPTQALELLLDQQSCLVQVLALMAAEGKADATLFAAQAAQREALQDALSAAGVSPPAELQAWRLLWPRSSRLAPLGTPGPLPACLPPRPRLLAPPPVPAALAAAAGPAWRLAAPARRAPRPLSPEPARRRTTRALRR
jgi:hypothetical protein